MLRRSTLKYHGISTKIASLKFKETIERRIKEWYFHLYNLHGSRATNRPANSSNSDIFLPQISSALSLIPRTYQQTNVQTMTIEAEIARYIN